MNRNVRWSCQRYVLKCTQPGKWEGESRDPGAVSDLWHHPNNWNVEGTADTTGLLPKKNTRFSAKAVREDKERGCPLCEEAHHMYGALL